MVLKKKDVVISNRAKASLKEIFDYIKNKEKSVETAQYVRKTILDKCLSLKDFSNYSLEPYLSEYPENYRSVSVWDFLIIFLSDEKTVKVLNIVHGKQHPEIRENI